MTPPAALVEERDELKRWLVHDAYPLWWERGADHRRGGFFERIAQNGAGLPDPRRARLHPRQIYCYSLADELGWNGVGATAVAHALEFYLQHYQRTDGLFRTLVDAEGTVLREDAVLYDQAFALLGLAAAFATLGDEHLRVRARDLLATLRSRLAHPFGGFLEGSASPPHLTTNSHMHLFEAALAWLESTNDPLWRALAEEIANLASTRFRAGDDIPIREFFVGDWQPATGPAGAIVEPGHQFEWAWLLMRWNRYTGDPALKATALALIDKAEAQGVARERGVVVNSIGVDGSILDPRARLWPQTERLKAACRAARLTGSARHWATAAQAAQVLRRYLDTPVHGLWRDVLNVDGTFVDEPAPASSFYHLVSAITELNSTCEEIR
jgi:mannose/cellobiose epimerase-like protein (N-acyl-D-glucosamine 2-epimerase family)